MQYWIANNADGSRVAGYTPDGYQTLPGAGVTIEWHTLSRTTWETFAKAAGLEVPEVPEPPVVETPIGEHVAHMESEIAELRRELEALKAK